MDDGDDAATTVDASERRRVQRRGPNRERRRHRINLRLDDDEWATIHGAAERSGLSDAGWCTEVGLAAAAGSTLPTPSVSRDALAELTLAQRQLRKYATNVNQAVAALHSTGAVPDYLVAAIATTDTAARRLSDAALVVGERL